jgi:hypothetical protein
MIRSEAKSGRTGEAIFITAGGMIAAAAYKDADCAVQ